MTTSERTAYGTAATPESSQARIGRLMDGYLSTQLLMVAAELGVADALAAGPRSSADLAAALDVDGGALHRVLRGLAADGVLAEHDDGRFGLTEAGELLREGRAGSQRGPVLARGRLYYGAAGGLLDAVRSGGTPFELVHGETFFEFLAARPGAAARFQGSMTDRSREEAGAVVGAYDFGGVRTLVDVGGGRGVLLGAVLAATPGLTGVLFDRPEVVAQARGYLTAAGTGRWDVADGNFFDAVPAGGDAYLLSRVVHDWDDDAATRILTACRRAMPGDGRLLMVEALLPERAADAPATTRMDLHMLVLLGGRERTLAEYRALLAGAGFVLTRAVPTPATVSVMEAVPVGETR